ncbi:14707_t:CDS:2, partial [Dentiscutata heterogama]
MINTCSKTRNELNIVINRYDYKLYTFLLNLLQHGLLNKKYFFDHINYQLFFKEFDFYREQADVKTVPKSYKEIGKTDSYNYLDLKLKLIVATSWKSYTTKYNESSIRKLDLSKSLEKDLLEIRKKRLNTVLEKKDYVMNNIVKNLTKCQDEKNYNSLLHEWEEKSFIVFEEFRNKNMTYKYKDYLSGKENNDINELFKTQYSLTNKIDNGAESKNKLDKINASVKKMLKLYEWKGDDGKDEVENINNLE